MTDPNGRALLAALAGRERTESGATDTAAVDGAYREAIDEAIDATADFRSAAAYLAEHDLDDLETAVERATADVSSRAEAGREALETLRELEAAADGEGQFQSGRSSHLGGDGVSARR